MDLNRLREIANQGRRPSPVPQRRELTYEPVDGDGQPLAARSDLPALSGAAWLDTPDGRVVVVDHEFGPDAWHGRVSMEHLARWDPEALSVINGRPLDVASSHDRRSPLFFDLETTGLSGGAGTVPFLVGCGYFDGETFRTRQFFLNGFAAEAVLLRAFSRFLDGTPMVVTYNGRTFDAPVMETRWLFHRLPVSLEGMPHLDMLPASRRLWRGLAEDASSGCRLVELETLLCGVVRQGDVPGFEIPQRYFEYVRHGDATVLEPVFYHNRMDLLSLAALTARAQRLVLEGAAAAEEPGECFALGRFLERRGRLAEAEECYRQTLALPTSASLREQSLHALARLLRRLRRFREAALVWQQLLDVGTGRTPAVKEAVDALAVHHEHRERDLLRAKTLALRALQQERDPRKRDRVSYRLARLDRKLADRPFSQPSLIRPG
ncbi:MAG: ribonuclease H-like domain-containing protein [Vicinamibacterales bacterium]